MTAGGNFRIARHPSTIRARTRLPRAPLLVNVSSRHRVVCLAWTRTEAVLFPQFVPLPNAARRLIGRAIAELVRQHQDLTSMVGLVGKHVGKHGCACGPCSSKAIARKFRDLALWPSGQRIGKHAQTLCRALPVRGRGLLHRTAVRTQRGRTLQVRSRIPEPCDTGVVKVCEDRGDGAAATALGSGRLGAPSPRVKMREKELVHRIIDRVGFQQHVANLDQ